MSRANPRRIDPNPPPRAPLPYNPEAERQGEPEVLRWAREYVQRGWAPVPLRPHDKAPIGKDWPQLRLAEEQLAASFGGGRNIGILTGRASGGLVDVDCDTPEAVAAAAVLLPPTGLVHGRPGKPASHYFYSVPELAPATPGEARKAVRSLGRVPFQFDAVDAQGKKSPTMLVELRGDGCQTMVPPSIHPCGEQLRWERYGEPGRVSWDALRRRVARVGACALLARHWPGQGSRDDAALALTGMLLRGGWTVGEANQLVTLTARIAGDEEWPKRAKGQASAERLQADAPVWGATRLATLLRGPSGDRTVVVALLRKWLGLRDEGGRRGSSLAQGDHVRRMIAYGGDDRLRDVRAPGEGEVETAAEGALLEAVLLSEVREEPLRWLWRGYILLGALTVLDGDPGLGKSLVSGDLVARVTTGRPMPDGSPGVEGGALLLCAEDSAAHTILPRLRAAGGRPERVKIVGSVKEPDPGPATDTMRERPFRLPDDTYLLERHAHEIDARLIVIDPLMAFMDPGLNSFKEQHMREALGPLVRLAAELGIAVLCVRHMTKGDGINPLYRGTGSIAIIAVARSGLVIANDPDDPDNSRVLASSKSNLGPPMPSLRYRIRSDQGSQEQEGEGEGTADVPTVEWLGVCDYTAAQLLSAVAPATRPASTPALDTACAFLRGALASGPRPATEVEDAARAAQIREATLKRARKRLDVQARRDGFGGPWVLALPPSGEPAGSSDTLSLPIWQSARPDGQAAPASPHLPTLSNGPGDPDPSKAIISPIGDHPVDMSAFAGDDPLRSLVPLRPWMVCPVTGTAHEYARPRDARGHPLCIHCHQAEPAGEPEADNVASTMKGSTPDER